MKRILIIIGLLGAAILARAVSAQGPQGAPAVTFQSEVTYVDVDATVTDQQGNLVTDLTREDFEVFEDGKPQKVEMFSFVDIPIEREMRFLGVDRPVAVDARTNRRPFTGRVYVIVLDDLDISPIRTAHTKKVAREFVEKHLGVNDMAAVVYTSGRTDAAQEFTEDRRLLLAAIDKFMGRRMRSAALERLDTYYQRLALTPSNPDDGSLPEDELLRTDPGGHQRLDPGDFERSHRAFGVLDTLKNLSEYLATVRGRRKAIVLISEGIDYPILDLFNTQSASEVIRAMQDAVRMAARSNVNFFTIDPRGLVGITSEFMELQGGGAPAVVNNPSLPYSAGITGQSGPLDAQSDFISELRVSQDTLRTLAEETGGFAALNSNSFVSAFDRIVEANSRYYVLGYYPPTHPRNGRFHKIEVRVKRPGLKVTARRGYSSPRGRTLEERKRDEAARRARDAKRPGADNTTPQLREAMITPIQQSGLTFTVQAAPFKNTAKEASVALAIEIDGDRIDFSPAKDGLLSNKIELSLYGINELGKAGSGTRTEVDLTLRPQTAERVRAEGLRMNPRIALAPGRYQLRVGARETLGGKAGSVFYDLTVPDFRKDPLMLSGMLITAASAAQTPTPQVDQMVTKLLPAPAMSRRQFAQDDVLSVYSEIYDNTTSRQPRQIDIAVRLIAETGREAFSVQDSLTNGGADISKRWSIYAYPREIPLKSLAPGRYLLRIEAQVRGSSDKPVAQETLITVGS
jgi:VWFA-related protein